MMITTPAVEVFSTEALIEHISTTTVHYEDALRETGAKASVHVIACYRMLSPTIV